jgi:hypothetical protein
LTDDRAFGADDFAASLYTGERLRKLRFLMTDNNFGPLPAMRDRGEFGHTDCEPDNLGYHLKTGHKLTLQRVFRTFGGSQGER